MTTNPIDAGVTSHIATLVRATYGAASAIDYCRYGSSLTLNVPGEGSVDFAQRAAMTVRYGEQHGGVKDSPCTITLPSDDALCELLYESIGPVDIVIAEVDPSDASSYRETFGGRVSLATKNPAGKDGVCELRVAGHKARLDVRLGMVADQYCQLRYGKAPCGVDLAALEVTATLDSVSASSVECTDVAVTGKASRFWQNGTITVDGLSMTIRDWESGSTFLLFDKPPARWAGASAVIRPGCVKTLSWCKTDGPHVPTQGSQEANFSGIGFAMLDYNPQYEKGGG